MNLAHSRFAAAAVLAALPLVTAGAWAQTRLEVTTHTGVFQPLRSILTTETMRIFGPVLGEADTIRTASRADHEAGFVIGAGVTVWLSERLGVEGALVYSFSDVEVHEEFDGFAQPSRTVDASVTSGTVRGVIRLNPGSGVHLDARAGLGFLTRNGEAFERLSGSTDFVVVAGSSVGIAIAPNVVLRLGLDDYISFAGFDGDELTSERQRQGNLTPSDEPAVTRRSGIQNDLLLIQTVSVSFDL